VIAKLYTSVLNGFPQLISWFTSSGAIHRVVPTGSSSEKHSLIFEEHDFQPSS
jgi:dihydrodipicolinate synthase/N-acetylneuraminate lyase